MGSDKSSKRKKLWVFEETKDFFSEYVLHECIGRGAFGQVFRCSHRKTKKARAVKVIHKAHFKQELHLFRQEITILKRIEEHPNVITFYDYFESSKFSFIVTTLCKGSDLYLYLKKKFKKPGIVHKHCPCFVKFCGFIDNSVYSEQEVAFWLRQVGKGLEYIHSKQVVHADIKPANIMLEDENRKVCKIIDFGLSSVTKKKHLIRNNDTGTPEYMSYEIVATGRYNSYTDLWSFGVLMFSMLFGYSPFHTASVYQTYQLILKHGFLPDGPTPGYANSFPRYHDCSPLAKDLIIKLLQNDPVKRLSATETLNHPWFRAATPHALGGRVMHIMTQTQHRSVLQRLLVNTLVETMDSKNIDSWRIPVDFDKKGNLVVGVGVDGIGGGGGEGAVIDYDQYMMVRELLTQQRLDANNAMALTKECDQGENCLDTVNTNSVGTEVNNCKNHSEKGSVSMNGDLGCETGKMSEKDKLQLKYSRHSSSEYKQPLLHVPLECDVPTDRVTLHSSGMSVEPVVPGTMTMGMFDDNKDLVSATALLGLNNGEQIDLGMDVDHSLLNMRDVLTTALEHTLLAKEERLWNVFDIIDSNKDGTLSISEIAQFFGIPEEAAVVVLNEAKRVGRIRQMEESGCDLDDSVSESGSEVKLTLDDFVNAFFSSEDTSIVETCHCPVNHMNMNTNMAYMYAPCDVTDATAFHYHHDHSHPHPLPLPQSTEYADVASVVSPGALSLPSPSTHTSSDPSTVTSSDSVLSVSTPLIVAPTHTHTHTHTHTPSPILLPTPVTMHPSPLLPSGVKPSPLLPSGGVNPSPSISPYYQNYYHNLYQIQLLHQQEGKQSASLPTSTTTSAPSTSAPSTSTSSTSTSTTTGQSVSVGANAGVGVGDLNITIKSPPSTTTSSSPSTTDARGNVTGNNRLLPPQKTYVRHTGSVHDLTVTIPNAEAYNGLINRYQLPDVPDTNDNTSLPSGDPSGPSSIDGSATDVAGSDHLPSLPPPSKSHSHSHSHSPPSTACIPPHQPSSIHNLSNLTLTHTRSGIPLSSILSSHPPLFSTHPNTPFSPFSPLSPHTPFTPATPYPLCRQHSTIPSLTPAASYMKHKQEEELKLLQLKLTLSQHILNMANKVKTGSRTNSSDNLSQPDVDNLNHHQPLSHTSNNPVQIASIPLFSAVSSNTKPSTLPRLYAGTPVPYTPLSQLNVPLTANTPHTNLSMTRTLTPLEAESVRGDMWKYGLLTDFTRRMAVLSHSLLKGLGKDVDSEDIPHVEGETNPQSDRSKIKVNDDVFVSTQISGDNVNIVEHDHMDNLTDSSPDSSPESSTDLTTHSPLISASHQSSAKTTVIPLAQPHSTQNPSQNISQNASQNVSQNPGQKLGGSTHTHNPRLPPLPPLATKPPPHPNPLKNPSEHTMFMNPTQTTSKNPSEHVPSDHLHSSVDLLDGLPQFDYSRYKPNPDALKAFEDIVSRNQPNVRVRVRTNPYSTINTNVNTVAYTPSPFSPFLAAQHLHQSNQSNNQFNHQFNQSNVAPDYVYNSSSATSPSLPTHSHSHSHSHSDTHNLAHPLNTSHTTHTSNTSNTSHTTHTSLTANSAGPLSTSASISTHTSSTTSSSANTSSVNTSGLTQNLSVSHTYTPPNSHSLTLNSQALSDASSLASHYHYNTNNYSPSFVADHHPSYPTLHPPLPPTNLYGVYGGLDITGVPGSEERVPRPRSLFTPTPSPTLPSTNSLPVSRTPVTPIITAPIIPGAPLVFGKSIIPHRNSSSDSPSLPPPSPIYTRSLSHSNTDCVSKLKNPLKTDCKIPFNRANTQFHPPLPSESHTATHTNSLNKTGTLSSGNYPFSQSVKSQSEYSLSHIRELGNQNELEIDDNDVVSLAMVANAYVAPGKKKKVSLPALQTQLGLDGGKEEERIRMEGIFRGVRSLAQHTTDMARRAEFEQNQFK